MYLSDDDVTAIVVGARHGKSVIYEVLTSQMYHDGYEFFQSVNVWIHRDYQIVLPNRSVANPTQMRLDQYTKTQSSDEKTQLMDRTTF